MQDPTSGKLRLGTARGVSDSDRACLLQKLLVNVHYVFNFNTFVFMRNAHLSEHHTNLEGFRVAKPQKYVKLT